MGAQAIPDKTDAGCGRCKPGAGAGILLGMDRTDVAATAQAILDYLVAYPPQTRIADRAELRRLGDAAVVDAALQKLERERKLGSPAPDWWMPLQPWTDPAGRARYAPPAGLRDLLCSILERHDVTPLPSRAERDYTAAVNQGDFGYGVPNYCTIGTDRPFPLVLRWGYGLSLTEYDGERTPMPPVTHSDPFGIHDMEAFMQACTGRDLNPLRAEKDLYVNCLLRATGDWNAGPDAEALGVELALGGGTRLTKGGDALRRFSEDVELYVIVPGHDPASPLDYDLVAGVTRSLQAHVEQALADLPGFGHAYTYPVDTEDLLLQQMMFRYEPYCQTQPGFAPVDPGLALELNCWPPAGLDAAMIADGGGVHIVPTPVVNVPALAGHR